MSKQFTASFLSSGTDPNQGGIPAPGLYTCTVTKSVYKESYREIDGENMISLLHSAAYCLNEELSINLVPEEYQAIKLHTLYLKFDHHEWGMCGYIDLSDEQINAELRLTSAKIQSRYSSSKKTKHDKLVSVTFDPDVVASFIRANLADMASSTKIVAVKALKAFYSHKVVEQAFKDE